MACRGPRYLTPHAYIAITRGYKEGYTPLLLPCPASASWVKGLKAVTLSARPTTQDTTRDAGGSSYTSKYPFLLTHDSDWRLVQG